MLKINENYKITADSYSYALHERRVTQKGEDSWNPIGYYTNIPGALKKIREINRKSLISADEILVLNDLIAAVEAIDEAFLAEINGLEERIEAEVELRQSALKPKAEVDSEENIVSETDAVSTQDAQTKPKSRTKRKPKKEKQKELPQCFISDQEDGLFCIGEADPDIFKESGCNTCSYYGSPESEVEE